MRIYVRVFILRLLTVRFCYSDAIRWLLAFSCKFQRISCDSVRCVNTISAPSKQPECRCWWNEHTHRPILQPVCKRAALRGYSAFYRILNGQKSDARAPSPVYARIRRRLSISTLFRFIAYCEYLCVAIFFSSTKIDDTRILLDHFFLIRLTADVWQKKMLTMMQIVNNFLAFIRPYSITVQRRVPASICLSASSRCSATITDGLMKYSKLSRVQIEK